MTNQSVPKTLVLQTFIIILVGFIILQGAGLFIFAAYGRIQRTALTPARLEHEALRIIELAKTVSPTDLATVIKHVRHDGISVRIRDNAAKNSTQIDLSNVKAIKTQIVQSPFKFAFSMALDNGRWLILRTNIVHSTSFNITFLFAVILLLAALVLFSWWLVRRLASSRAVINLQNHIRQLLIDRTQMLAAISHDLRTPITRLKLRLENFKETEQGQKALKDLDEMDNMIGSILTFSSDSYREEVSSRFDLASLLEAICTDNADMGRPVHFEEFDGRLPFTGRYHALKRVLQNIIDNAIKYGGDKVNVSVKQSGGGIQIKIADNGPGIPEDKFAKVFMPFYRGDKARSPTKSGSGLGLAVARDIVRAHGGDIELRNLSPHGLLVTVTL